MRIILPCLLLFVNVCFAQRECASHDYIGFLKSDPSVAQRLLAAENFISSANNSVSANASTEKTTEETSKNIIRIPVVVHVIYNSASQNISDEQITSQIEALNRDFRRHNADTVNTPGRFTRLAADVAIEFVLATADPNGSPTKGIVRKHTNVADWSGDDKIKFSAQGGDNAWDSKSYLNIWVGNLRRLLGYSSAPGAPAERDGIVLATSVFGTFNVSSPYNLGRTAVHEAGHWLGLRHIWGDTYCGDDGIDDTPQQGNFTPGCPTGFRSSCNNATTGDMYMNYMDFTYDGCLNLFTEGQKDRMRACFLGGGPRYSFTYSKGLNTPWTDGIFLEQNDAATVHLTMYPNPAIASITIDAGNDATWIGKKIRIVNMNGVTVIHLILSSGKQVLSLNQLAPGNYLLVAENGKKPISKAFIKL
jgi:hypothetical protein